MVYGFVPQTCCSNRVNELSLKAKREDRVLIERLISRSEMIVSAKVVGGLQVVDGEEADDKIIAVLANGNIWASTSDVRELQVATVERLPHYFPTYKNRP